MSKLSYKSLFIILFFLLIGIIVLAKFVLPNNKVSAAWWNDGWNYRKAVNISNSSGSNLTDFQVSISIGTSALIANGKMQSDCDDIRVTDINGNLLPYWIEENNPGCNQITDTKIWIKASSIPTSGSTVYVYYGNSTTNNNENGEQVFDFFDDFNDSSLDTSKWTTVVKGVGGSVGVAGGTAILSPTQNTTSSVNLLSTTTFTNNIAIEIRRKQASNNSYMELSLGSGNVVDENMATFSWWHTTLNLGYYWFFQATNNSSNGIYLMNNTSKSGIYVSSYTLDTSMYYTQKMTLNSSGTVTQSTNGTVVLSGTNPTFTGSQKNILISQGEYSTGGGDAQYVDYIFVHKIASTDPTSTLQSEEVGGGPIAYWKFDEGVGTTAYDSSSNQNNGVINGATWISEDQCISGKCLNFNNNYLSILDNPSLNITNTITIETWVKTTDITQNSYIIAKDNGNTYRAYSIKIESGKIRFLLWNSSETLVDIFSNDGIISNNNWFHIAALRNGSGVMQLYINGILQTDTDNISNIRSINNDLNIGRLTSGAYPFNGYVDEPKIYPYARTADQIKNDYNSRGANKGTTANLGTDKNNSGALSEGLVGYWKMEEGTGTTTLDSSGNNNTGTLNTTVGWSSGKFGVGTSYDGVNSHNTTIANNIPLTNQATFSLWIKPNANWGNWAIFLDKSSVFRVQRYMTTNQLAFYDFVNTSPHGGTINVDAWNHIVVIVDNGIVKGFVNNIEAFSGIARNPLTITSGLTSIGCSTSGLECFNGLVDEVRIYNRALSPTEVTQLYEYAPGPVGYWDFEENTGTVVKDKSGNNNNGTWSGAGSHWIAGKVGSAGNFNAINSDYVDCGNSSSILSPKYAITLSSWVKYEATSGEYYGIFQKNGYANWFSVRVGDGFTVWYTNINNWAISDFSGLLIDKQWHYITATYDSSVSTNNMKFYIDGLLKAQTTASGTFVNDSNPFKIGAPPNSYFQGKIDEVKVYNYARTQKQIIEDMNGNRPTSSTKSMLAHYKFDEGNGTITNNSGNGGIGFSGAFGAGNSAPTWTNDGKFNKALNFTGSNQVKTNLSLNNSLPWTYTFWINRKNVISADDEIINGGNNNPRIWFWSNKINIAYTNSSSTYKDLFVGSDLNLNRWYHIALVWNGSQFSLYKDSVLDASATAPDGMISSSNISFGSIWNNSFNGSMDEVKIYNYALTAEEIKQDYNQGSTFQMGSTTQTIGNTTTSLEYCIPGDTSYCSSPSLEYNFEENTGLTTKDISGNNNNATFAVGNSAPTWISGKNGSALNFDGINDRVIIGNPSVLDFSTNSFTLGLWIYNTEFITAYDMPFYKSGGSPANPGLDFELGSGTWNSSIADGTTNRYLSFGTGTTNVWIYLTAVVDRTSNKFILYRNGIQTDSTSISGMGSLSTGVTATLSSSSYPFKGKIDNLRFYNYARTPAQVAYDYNKGAPTGWWKFDECQGNIANNSSGIGSSGSINIGPSGTQTSLGTCTTSGTAWGNSANGKVNSSLNFDGADDYMTAPITVSGFEATISLWVKNPATGAGSYLLRSNANNRTYITVSGSNINVTKGDPAVSLGTYPITTTKWNNVIVKWWSNSSITYGQAYINGNAIGVGKTFFDNNQGSYITVAGFNNTGTQNASGQFDDVRVYNYALTNEQIKTLYNGGAVSFN